MKYLSSIIVFVFLSLPLTVLAGSFNDVKDDHPNFQAIEFLKQFDVVNGYDDGTFRPDNKVNRAEALKMILLAGGVEISEVNPDENTDGDTGEEGTKSFSDVVKDVWFYNFIGTAVTNKIVDGYDDGTFKPDRPVILAEALKMTFQAFAIDELPTEFKNPYPDVSNELWFAPFASFTSAKNITFPQDDGFLHAEKEITRAELAEILYRFRYVANHDLEAVPFTLKWTTYKDGDLAIQTLIPPNWELINNPRSVLLWKKDPAFTNVHPEWLYPNSGTITFSSYENMENFSKEDFFEQLKLSSTYAYDKVESIEMKVSGFDVLKINKSDSNTSTYIFELDNERFLVVFTDYGDGDYSDHLKKTIDAVLNNISNFEKTPPDPLALKSEVFAKVLIEGAVSELLDALPDESLIETDSLGVGTGPVDYYYSELIDLTLKVERDGQTLLDTREGQTTAF